MRKRIQSLPYLWRAVVLVWSSSRLWTAASLIIVLAQSVIPVLLLYLTQALVDALTQNAASIQMDMLLPVILIFGVVLLVNAALNALSTIVSEAQTLAVADHITRTIHDKSIIVDLAYYENAAFYDQLHRAQQDAPYVPAQIVSGIFSTLQAVLSLAGITILLIALHPLVALALLITGIPALIVRLRSSRLLYAWMQRSAATERRTNYLNYLLTYEDHAKEVRLFGIGDIFARRYDTLRQQLRGERLSLTKRSAVFQLIAQVISVFVLIITFIFIAERTVAGAITVGGFIIYLQAFQQGQNLVGMLLGGLASLYQNNLFLKSYYEFLALENTVAVPTQPRPIPVPFQEGFRFEGVSFAYANSSAPILENIDLTIGKGEMIALVGDNGAGKTTLIKLLCRLYDPTAGRITLDGVDLREYDPAELRRHISVVFQDYAQYQLPAWENIWLGNADLPDDRSPIIKAAQNADAHEMISHLQQGYDTPLGNWFPEGHELSIGQWQRIAIARALFRDAQLVVLDEPTSALDVMTEHEVLENFRRMITGRSAVVISHRLSTTRFADRIYVLKDGRIAESGSHDVLMAQNGIYAGLFRTQSRYYQ